MLTPEAFAVYSRPKFFNWRGRLFARIKNVRYPGEYSGSSLRKSQSGTDCRRCSCGLRTAGRQSAKVQFGDYQANGVMAVAKKLGMPPRQLAEQVLTHLDLTGIASKTEIAGPGFINIFLELLSWHATLTRR